jgi:hypothetical protein
MDEVEPIGTIEVHLYCQCEFGEQALLTYQAHIRQSWHDALKQNSAFNITLFNEDLLQFIYKEVIDKAQLESLNEVSFTPFPSPLYQILMDSPPFFPL